MKPLLHAALLGTLSVIGVCLLDYFLMVYGEREPLPADGDEETPSPPEAKLMEFVLKLEHKFQESWKE